MGMGGRWVQKGVNSADYCADLWAVQAVCHSIGEDVDGRSRLLRAAGFFSSEGVVVLGSQEAERGPGRLMEGISKRVEGE